MKSRFCFVFAVSCFTAILIFTVYLRNSNNRISYKLYVANVEQSRLKQELWHKQLQLEGLISPASVSERLDKNSE